MSERPLTPKQALFVAEYLKDLNATAAAGRAGYKDPNIGRQLITKHNVAEAVAAGQAERTKRTQVGQDWVIERLKREAQAEGEGSSHGARVKALELLGKHVGMWKDVGTKDNPFTIQTLRGLTRDDIIGAPQS